MARRDVKADFRGGRDRVLAGMLMRSALPLIRVLVQDDPKLARRYSGWRKTIQFEVRGDANLACHLVFGGGRTEFAFGRLERPDLAFVFKNAKRFNTLMTGGPALLKVRGLLRHPITLIGFVPLLLKLTILLPSRKPRTPDGRALKVKLLLYFITAALSQLNRLEDPDVRRFTEGSPDRIYQWSVRPAGPAAYLRIHRGNTKSGRGMFTGRRPFVHMIFSSIEGAFAVLTGRVDNVEAMKQGLLVIDGSPEHGKDVAGLMKRVEAMMLESGARK